MNTAFPKVSVIIPTHNRAHVIRRALRSVLCQTYGNLEVIVVDDASTDDTVEVVQSVNDNRIIFLRQETRQGAAAARNVGIRAASGEFIAFQDSDDEWLNEKLEKQMAVLLHANNVVGVVYSGFLRFEGRSAKYFPSTQIKIKSGSILSVLLSGNFVTTQAVVVRKECLVKVGLFDEQFPRLQDWELFLRLAVLYEFVCIDEPLLIAFHSPQSITADRALFPIALKMLLEKHQKEFLGHPIVLAKHYLILSLLAVKKGKFFNGTQYLGKSLRALWSRGFLN
jgi:glycosyltransferase involved in cell wall biosynthesis